jgi:hypothetical protein
MWDTEKASHVGTYSHGCMAFTHDMQAMCG